MPDRPSTSPLAGKRIVLTRPHDVTSPWRKRLEELGANVIELPLIKVTKEVDRNTLAEVFTELGRYEWLVFTSANGARFFFEDFHKAFDDIRALGLVRIAVVGESTAEVVRAQHLRVELQPEKANAAELAEKLIERESLDSAKVLVVTGNLNRDTLVDKLNEARAIVDRLPIYRTEANDVASDPVTNDFRQKGADAILFASPSSAQSFFDQAGTLKLGAKAVRPIAGSIGPTTTAAMKQLGLPVDFEAPEASLDSLLGALMKKL
ncbi:MAG TPA: uroporphyrinogen-III synthase [Candidatus Didemnitutus sp.]|nr:uroporphyrinogen-III synthase [Candidatus Didemnitutus sp.]